MRYGAGLIDGIGGYFDLCGGLHPIGSGEVDEGQYDSNIDDLDFIGIQIIRRKVIDQVGLFDPGYSPFFSEDVDLCYRIRKAGQQIGKINAATDRHRGDRAALNDQKGNPSADKRRQRPVRFAQVNVLSS
jgi:GT2 family glycosyltransferase